MKIASPKYLEIHKMFKYEYLKKNLIEFFNNKHKHMKVIDALRQVC